MDYLFTSLSVLLCMATLVYSQTNYDVTSYGAVGDGTTDDSQAFLKTWEQVCGATSDSPTLYIPEGKTFFLNPTRFQGPCNSPVRVQVLGDIVGPQDASAWGEKDAIMWLTLAGLNGLQVFGTGKFDGRGETWWKSCPFMNDCKRPTALAFLGCTNLELSGFTSINSAQNHISIVGCEGVTISNLQLHAPGDSPNTDGIRIGSSTNVQIFYSTIATGDDCVAISSGSTFINVSRVACGPGHGISIGSLGIDGEISTVEEVHVEHCSFSGTQNGARIKTWQGGVGYARKISFENIQLYSAGNPIIIDQYYCPYEKCSNKSKAVAISDISFVGIEGTSSVEEAINFSCSENIPCTNIVVDNVNITSAVPNKQTFAYCLNARGKSSNSVPNVDCLSG